MKVIEFIKKSNKKKNISPERLLELKQYYISMYRFYMVKLYDEGYIDDPTIFKKEQIISNIVDLNIKGLYNISGQLQLSSRWVKYAFYKNEDKEAKRFLYILYNILKYREYNKNLDMFYEKFNVSVSLQLGQTGAMIYSKSNITLDRGCLCAMTPKGTTIEVLSIKEDIWVEAMKMLNIPEDEWYSDGLFDKDLSHELEVEFSDLILNGILKLDGKYASNLTDWLFSHKWSKRGMSIEKQGLMSYIFSSCSDAIFSALSTKLNSVDPSRVVAFQQDEIYIVKDIKNYKIPISYFAVYSGYDDQLVCESNYMYGYTGEAYNSNYLDDEGISYIGLPVKVVLEGNTEIYLYDREQVDIKSDTWFNVEGVDFYFEGSDLENPFKETESLDYKMFEIFKKAQSGILGAINLEDYSIKEIEKSKKQISARLVKGV